MDNFTLNKKIEELHGIPGTWGSEQKDHFLDTGYLPMAGLTPQNKYKTKKITIADLNHNLSAMLSTITVHGTSALSADGSFSVTMDRGAGDGISVTGGQVTILPGWYQYMAQVSLSYSGTPLNRHDLITLGCNLHSQSNKCDFDFSVQHSEMVDICGLVNIANTEAQNLTLSVSGIPSGVSNFTATLNFLSVIAVRVNS